MTTFNIEEYNQAVAGWGKCCGDYSVLKKLIPPNFVFELNLDQINWLKKSNQYKEFCTEIGVYSDQLVLILCPLDQNGQKMPVTDYPYSILAELSNDLKLTEEQEYTVIKNAVISKDLRKVDNNSNMYFPITSTPVMDQDRAIDAIESWRNEGMSWFYRECTEFRGTRIFQKFYVPSEDLTPIKDNLSGIVCSFGLKFSDVYQRMLVTLIFISFYKENLEGSNGSAQTISNTYDWSQPCPPLYP